MKRIFAVDVGGTEIKAGIVDISGEIVGEIRSYSSCSNGTKQDIIDNFKKIFLELYAVENNIQALALALAFPGNFDYENGICLMENVGKYDGIYGCDLKSEFKQLLTAEEFAFKPDFPIYFLNDVSAFTIGAAGLGNDPNERILSICIGTGCGSAFMVNGRLAPEGERGVPPKGWVFCMPYKDSIIDDYLSKRGLTAISKRLFGREIEGLELAQMVKSGDIKARDCFLEFGENIALALEPIFKSFAPTRLIFGGQIAKSFHIFGDALKNLCSENNVLLEIVTETSQMALKGLAKTFIIGG